jgi:hypothetical protein
MAQKNKGALGKDPKFTVSEDPTQRARQQRKWEMLAKQGDKSAKANLEAIKAYQAPVAPTPQEQQGQQATDQYNGIIEQAGGVQTQLLDQAKGRGDFNPQTMGIQQFNPGDFQGQFQGAYDSALNQFNRSSQPAFDKQNADFQQMAAERGWDPSSKVYQDSIKQIQDSQNTARLNAQDTAYQTGLGAQQQAYGQSSNTYGQNLGAQGQQFGQATTQYQMPFSNLSALSPYLQAQYGSQMAGQQQGYTQANAAQSQDYAKELAAIQQKYAIQLQNNAPRGGGGGGGSGGLTLADQMALQNNQFYNNMVLGGLNQQQPFNPGVGNSALGGFASGVGAGIGAGLAK